MLTKTEIEKLSPDESIELAVLLWDHAYEAASAKPLSEEQKHELDLRFEHSVQNPGSARPWEEVMNELESKYGKI